MRKILAGGLIAVVAALAAGCSPAFWGGTGTGVVGAGAGYELNARKQMEQLNEDLKAGRINQQEYEIRKDQIERGSLVY